MLTEFPIVDADVHICSVKPLLEKAITKNATNGFANKISRIFQSKPINHLPCRSIVRGTCSQELYRKTPAKHVRWSSSTNS